VLYVTGLAAHLFWFMFEDSETWRQRSIEYRTDYRMLAPNGIDPSVFHNRGAYGRYYAHQAAVKNGYCLRSARRDITNRSTLCVCIDV